MEPKALRAYFEYLKMADDARKSQDYAESFAWLEFAHILAQKEFISHFAVHLKMLWLGILTWDWKEIWGQIYRLCLTPFGHLLGRLPVGNTGRANVSAFAPMKIPDELVEIFTPDETP